MRKFFASVSTALLIAAGSVGATTIAANATPPIEVCTPAEAWTETIIVTPEIPAVPAVPAVPEQLEVSHDEYQRYSWTGGPTEAAPTEVPPSPNWQANTSNYEGAGKGDPVGVAFQGNGKADWFFWTKTKVVDKPYVPGTPEIPGTPAVPAVTQTIEHPAVTCEEENPTIDPVVCSPNGDWYTEGDDLAPVATPEGLVFAGGSGKAVGTRLPVTGNLQGWTSASFDADGGTEQFFFRIVIDASADGGPAYKSLSFPGYTTIDQDSVSYQYGESLAATAERFPNAVITSVGFQTNSGAPADYSATLRSFSSDCANVNWTYTEEPPVVNDCVDGVSTHSTNLNHLWSNVDTRSAGHWEYVEGGMHLWTDDNSSQAKVSLGQGISFPLHDTCEIEIGWTDYTPSGVSTFAASSSTPPGLNLFITSEFGSGTLVYESVYGQDLWLTNGSSQGLKDNAPVIGGGNGSQWHGTIDQWLAKIPTAQVVGIAFSLGSGVQSDGVLTSITVGGGTHTFDLIADEVEEPEEPTPTPTTPTPSETVTPQPTETPAPASVTVATELAETGGTTMVPFLWFAGSVIVAGVIAISVMAVVQRRRKVETDSTE